jgi:hypothetical protein
MLLVLLNLWVLMCVLRERCWVVGCWVPLTLLGSWVLGAADAAGWVGAAGAAEVRRYAGVLREAVGLLDIGYCAKLLSCCDAGVLLKAVGC